MWNGEASGRGREPPAAAHPSAGHSVSTKATRSFFSSSVSFRPNTRLKNSTVSSSVRQRPSCRYDGLGKMWGEFRGEGNFAPQEGVDGCPETRRERASDDPARGNVLPEACRARESSSPAPPLSVRLIPPARTTARRHRPHHVRVLSTFAFCLPTRGPFLVRPSLCLPLLHAAPRLQAPLRRTSPRAS